MTHRPDKLTNIRVKTARMLELHDLLAQELNSDQSLAIPPDERLKLDRAISTIAAAMKDLQENFTAGEETNAANPATSGEQAPRGSAAQMHSWLADLTQAPRSRP